MLAERLHPEPIPSLTETPSMVRRGSTVRVRQRALQKPRKPRLPVSGALARSTACARYGALCGAFSSRSVSVSRQNRPHRDQELLRAATPPRGPLLYHARGRGFESRRFRPLHTAFPAALSWRATKHAVNACFGRTATMRPSSSQTRSKINWGSSRFASGSPSPGQKMPKSSSTRPANSGVRAGLPRIRRALPRGPRAAQRTPAL
jgi:hypothetical protein